MSNRQVAAVLGRIDSDLALLRKLLGEEGKPAKHNSVKVPVLKSKYTKAEADTVRAQIDAACDAGLITPDKRRGMKMCVTKATRGWAGRR